MRVVALISGGKDSIYNVMQCVAANHDIVALANIYPEPIGVDELDSFMYQTVGHEGIELLAEATGLPLYRQTTKGKAHFDGLNYKSTPEDEVEDLYVLLSRVKDEIKCEGVAVGAIASDYQRTRVENVCSRLGLTSLCYLWQQDQAQLLNQMINANIDAITVKVAAMGLDPEKHLGFSIRTLQPVVTSLNSKYGVNICGEGGEYETFVLDCPFFHKKIKIVESKKVQETDTDIAATAHLVILKASLEHKFGQLSPLETLPARLEEVRRLVPSPLRYIFDWASEENCTTATSTGKSCKNENTFKLEPAKSNETFQPWSYVSNILAKDITQAVLSAKEKLALDKLELRDVVNANLWLKNMGDFSEVNRQYVQSLGGNAPTRACVATELTAETPFLLELTACRKNPLKVIHVQSISHWAPANIGPYSQGIMVNGLIFVSGQIPLIPGSMVLYEGTVEQQARLCTRHSQAVLQSCGADLSNALMVTAFVSKQEYVSVAISTLKKTLPNEHTTLTAVAVTTLPRSADIEVIITASTSASLTSTVIEGKEDNLAYKLQLSKTASERALVGHVLIEGKTEVKAESISKILDRCFSHGTWAISFKCMYTGAIKKELLWPESERRLITLVPVTALQQDNQIIAITALDSIA